MLQFPCSLKPLGGAHTTYPCSAYSTHTNQTIGSSGFLQEILRQRMENYKTINSCHPIKWLWLLSRGGRLQGCTIPLQEVLT